MKNGDIEVARVVVKMGDVEVTLTPAEAKELHKVLGEMFGVKETIIGYPYPVIQPYRPYRNPYWEYTYTNTESGSTYSISATSQSMNDGGAV